MLPIIQLVKNIFNHLISSQFRVQCVVFDIFVILGCQNYHLDIDMSFLNLLYQCHLIMLSLLRVSKYSFFLIECLNDLIQLYNIYKIIQ